MTSTVLVIALMIVGWVAGTLLMRRFPTVSYTQIFCAAAAWFFGVLIVARPMGSPFWHYTGLLIAVIMGSFLLLVFFRRLDTPRSSGPA